jgi:hypothetical protein
MNTTTRNTTVNLIKTLGLTAEQTAALVGRLDAERAEAARNERARCKEMLEWYTAQPVQTVPVKDYTLSLLSADY